MSESGNANKANTADAVHSERSGCAFFSAPRLDSFNILPHHEERLEWVKKSYERFFEKLLEIDALVGLPELN